jgi:hypothetical protein
MICASFSSRQSYKESRRMIRPFSKNHSDVKELQPSSSSEFFSVYT